MAEDLLDLDMPPKDYESATKALMEAYAQLPKAQSGLDSHSFCLRFARRSLRYMDGYRKGLNGSEAAWASRKYRGHRSIPADATKEMISEAMKVKSNRMPSL